MVPAALTRLNARVPRVSPTVFRRVCLLALVLLGAIVVSGAGVRLTGSGLGCPTWPRCTDASFVSTPEYATHGLIEFGNRVITLGVGLVVLAVPLLALRLDGRRRDLTRLSFGLWVGYLGQAVLGGITVLVHLDPLAVAGHFLLSMLLLWDVTVLHHRARELETRSVRRRPRPELLWLTRGLAVVAAGTLALGTVVTGSGPHSGDVVATNRFPFDLERVAQLHTDAALLLTGLVLASILTVRLANAPVRAVRRVQTLGVLLVAQVTLGFVQYFLGIPAGLVGLHVALAAALWVVALRVPLALTSTGNDAAPLARPDRVGARAARAPSTLRELETLRA